MTGLVLDDASIDPKQLFDDDTIDTEERTYTHGDADHCETDAVGRAIVGVIDRDDRLLLLVDPEEGHVVLPNDTIAPGENWATVGREWVEGAAGIDVTLDSVEHVRRVEHVIEGEETPRSITHHVVFGGAVASAEAEETIPDGLCADNPFELGWYDAVPVESEDKGGSLDDIQLFLD